MDNKKNFTVKIETDNNSKVIATIFISKEEIRKSVDKTYKKLSKFVEISGFRKGMAPKEMILSKLGPRLYEETINDIIPEFTSTALDENNLRPLEQVKYEIVNFDLEKGLEYKARFTIFPDIKIGDLKKIKVKKEKVEANPEDIENVLKEMFTSWKDHIVKVKKEEPKYKKPDDEWAKEESGFEVKNLNELKGRIMLEVKRQKETNSDNAYKSDILKEAVNLTKTNPPEVLVKNELNRRLKAYKARIESLKLNFESFLKSQKTTEEKLIKGWRADAENTVRSELFFYEFIKSNNIEVKKDEIEKELNSIEDEKLKKQYNTPQGYEYIKNILLRQKAFQKLLSIVEESK